MTLSKEKNKFKTKLVEYDHSKSMSENAEFYKRNAELYEEHCASDIKLKCPGCHNETKIVDDGQNHNYSVICEVCHGMFVYDYETFEPADYSPFSRGYLHRLSKRHLLTCRTFDWLKEHIGEDELETIMNECTELLQEECNDRDVYIEDSVVCWVDELAVIVYAKSTKGSYCKAYVEYQTVKTADKWKHLEDWRLKTGVEFEVASSSLEMSSKDVYDAFYLFAENFKTV